MRCEKILETLQKLAPQSYAMSWDNSGFLVGRSEKEVKRVAVALDATNEVVNRAVKDKVDLLVTHHPIIFSSMKQINDTNFLGRKLLTLIENKINCYAMHTNFDIAGGMPELAADKIGLYAKEPLEITNQLQDRMLGIGKIGTLEEVITLEECTKRIKEAFHLNQVTVFGEQEREIKKIAISPGSGRSMIEIAAKKGADVIITGDIGHHEGLDAIDMGIAVIDAGHYGLEHIFIDFVAEYLKRETEGVEILQYLSGIPFQIV